MSFYKNQTQKISFRFYIISFLLLIHLSQSLLAQQKKTTPPPKPTGFALIELFTSEGSNTCPAADSLLKKLVDESKKNKTPVYAIAYHVDYWNKNGWKDPYGTYGFSIKQKNYMFSLNLPDLYTPQMIVNGQTTFVGSDEKKARKTIDAEIKNPATVLLEIKKDSVVRDTLFVSYKSSKADKNYFIRVVIVESNLISNVTAGENKGKTLTHTNVARVFYSTDLKEVNGVVKIPLKKFAPNKNCSIISFVQHKQNSKVLGVCQVNY